MNSVSELKIETGAQQLAEAIKAQGVERVFLYPGGTIAPLLDELVKIGLEYVCCRSEQGAGFAALAAAKITGRPQIVMVTSGPGATNALTPVADAYFDSVPLILIAGQVGTADINSQRKVRQTGFQEIDTIAVYQPVAKLTKRVSRTDYLPALMASVFTAVSSGRPGPAVLELPMDVQRSVATVTPATATALTWDFLEPTTPVMPTLAAETIAELLAHLRRARRPLLLLGNGVYLADAVEECRAFLAATRVPVVSSFPGLGIIPCAHPLNYGYIGYSGEYFANLALNEADLVLCLGARLDLRQTGSEIQHFKHNKTLVRVDVDMRELREGRVQADLHIHCDLRTFFSALSSQAVPALDTRAWCERIDGWRSQYRSDVFYQHELLSSYHVIKHFSQQTQFQKLVVTTGVGTHQQLVARYFDFDFPARRWLTSSGLGTMGFDLPAIIGAMMCGAGPKLGLCFVGDGSLQMNLQELAMLKEFSLPIKVIVLNNQRLGIVSQFQLQNWDSDHATGNKYNPDFAAIARAYDIPAWTCSDKAQLPKLVAEVLAEPGPALLQCHINSNEDLKPMLLAGQTLAEMFPFSEQK